MRTWLLLPWLLPLAAGAQAQGMYKWVDEKGVVHYTDTPPPGRHAEKKHIAPQPPLDGSASPRPGRSWQEQLQESNERRHREEQAQQRQQKAEKEAERKCQRARSALNSLKRERPIYRVNKEGEREYMSDEERQQQLERWQRQADAHCR